MRNSIRSLAALCVLLLAATASSALTVSSASLGGDKVCTTLACSTQTHSFAGSTPGGSGGSIVLSGSTLTFSIDAGDATFGALGRDPTLALQNLVLSGSAALYSVGGGAYAIVGGGGVVTGSANSVAFSSQVNSIGGLCTTIGGGLSCGITFSYFSGAGLSATRAVHAAVNVSAIPEPAAAAVFAAGAGLLAAVLRRRSN